jgi:Protein of unknown function (DUF3522)
MGLSVEEKRLMLLITGLTNFSCFPSLYVIYHKGMYFQFHVGVFTFITSFMYHSLESVEWKQFYIETSTWHKLDNIGSITCFIMLFVYWMDNLYYKKGSYYSKHSVPTDLHLNMIGLFLTMLMQAKGPWALENTIYPILLYFILFILKVLFVRRPRFNGYYIKRGACMLFIAIFFFSKGLDENTDYLRINHGMWHCFVGISSFFLWQSIDKDRVISSEIIKYPNQPRFEIRFVLKKILTLNFFKDEKNIVNKVS